MNQKVTRSGGIGVYKCSEYYIQFVYTIGIYSQYILSKPYSYSPGRLSYKQPDIVLFYLMLYLLYSFFIIKRARMTSN